MNWDELVAKSKAKPLEQKLNLPKAFRDNWKTTEADVKLAWELYSELRTRITTQPLHYMHGDEASALTSLVDFFKLAREKVRSYGPEARACSTLVVFTLNSVIRPFTAEWHKKLLAEELTREDSRHVFRTKFAKLQIMLRQFGTMLAVIAEKDSYCENIESWPSLPETKATDTPKLEAGCKKPTPIQTTIPLSILFNTKVKVEQQTAIFNAESTAIIARREAIGKTGAAVSPVDVAGLAISGGGIRSAAFALGAVQELVNRGVMRDFDYLSTVSGGGYTGAFLSSYLNSDDPNKTISLKKDDLPFHEQGADKSGAGESLSGESQPLRHLRAHSKFLLVGGLRNSLAALVILIYGFLANAMILLPILAAVLLSVAYLEKPELIACLNDRTHGIIGYIVNDNLMLSLLAICVFAFGSIAVVDLINRIARRQALLRNWQLFVGMVFSVAVLLMVWRIVPFILCQSGKLLAINGSKIASPSFLIGTAGISGIVMFLQRAFAAVSTADPTGKLKRFLGIAILAVFGPLLVLTVFLLLGHYTLVAPLIDSAGKVPDGTLFLWPLWALLGLGAFTIFFVDINQSSLHPFYRWKLSEAFVVRRSKASTGEVEINDELLLSEMRTHNVAGPYHLINAALNGPASTSGSFRGRGTDFYLFSAAYCGAESLGYRPTTDLEKVDPKLNLATAMAISGAAASPVTGVVKIPIRRFLLALFNVRLDYWLPNLNAYRFPIFGQIPGPWYLIRQAMGWMHERTSYVNVSDGGHIENLGLYELLRRHCRYIVVVDGECDPNMRCGAFVQAQRFAKLDFDVDINLDLSRFHVTEAGASTFHFALGEIDYHLSNDASNNPKGQLLYVKLSRTGNEPPGVEHYRLLNAQFPHQSTADQFFDEYQFEAYRALGEHATADAFSDEVHDVQPTSLSALFSNLAKALKDPNYL